MTRRRFAYVNWMYSESKLIAVPSETLVPTSAHQRSQCPLSYGLTASARASDATLPAMVKPIAPPIDFSFTASQLTLQSEEVRIRHLSLFCIFCESAHNWDMFSMFPNLPSPQCIRVVSALSKPALSDTMWWAMRCGPTYPTYQTYWIFVKKGTPECRTPPITCARPAFGASLSQYGTGLSGLHWLHAPFT